MKTAIVYYSAHHGNTLKLISAIEKQGDVMLIDAREPFRDLSEYDLIGFASGIYYQRFHKSVMEYIEKNLPRGKAVFFIYTCGMDMKSYICAIEKLAKLKGADIKGVFSCLGYDTFGPFKLLGGIAKGRPDDGDVEAVVRFFSGISHA